MTLKIIIFLAVIAVLMLADLPGLLQVPKKNRKKTILISGFLLLLGCSLGLLLILDRAPVSISVLMEKALYFILEI